MQGTSLSGAIYGRDVEYNSAEGTYLVIDSTSGVASGSSNNSLATEYHYTCGLDNSNNPLTTCATVRFYFLTFNGEEYYIELQNGEKIEDVLKNMINYKVSGDDENINIHSSDLKDYLEIWYDKNLKVYENYLDTNAVYCNNRKVTNLGGWSKTGALENNLIEFKQHVYNNVDLDCENETDRFSKANIKARIKNPIGAITEAERGLMGRAYALTEAIYWGLSPDYFNRYGANVCIVDVSGYGYSNYTFRVRGVRPAITLKPGIEIIKGNGQKDTPYQIGPLVTRNVYSKVG